MTDEKKLGGVAVEKEGDEMVAIAAKNYYIKTEKKDIMKCKGVSMKRNKEITPQSYTDVLKNHEPVMGTNCNLQIRKVDGEAVMIKNLINKVAISGIHTKMVALENQSCAPYIFGLNADCYVCL
jgi:hypothetical protein